MPSTPTHLFRIKSISSGDDDLDFIALNINFHRRVKGVVSRLVRSGQSILIKVDTRCLVCYCPQGRYPRPYLLGI